MSMCHVQLVMDTDRVDLERSKEGPLLTQHTLNNGKQQHLGWVNVKREFIQGPAPISNGIMTICWENINMAVQDLCGSAHKATSLAISQLL